VSPQTPFFLNGAWTSGRDAPFWPKAALAIFGWSFLTRHPFASPSAQECGLLEAQAGQNLPHSRLTDQPQRDLAM
jgi:hypothetical protein